MIEVRNLTKNFEGKVVLNDVSTKFKESTVNMIIGKSGSGKTVLLKCLIGLMRPASGTIYYDNTDITKIRLVDLKKIRQTMGMLFQGAALFDSKTVLENVMFPLDMFSTQTKAERIERAKFCLEQVRLTDSINLSPSEISGGMKKRTAIARAIALNPKYLFCDEPNSGLDPKSSFLIDQLILEITHNLGITSIVVSHDMNSVMNIGDNIIFINDGILEWEGTKDNVIESGNTTLDEFIFASDVFKKMKLADDIIKMREAKGY